MALACAADAVALYDRLLEGNRYWVETKLEQDPDYFSRLTQGQRPAFLLIGCSDSRVAPDQLTSTQPGEIFIHRNVANLIVNTYLQSKGIEGLKPEYLPLKATNEEIAAAVGRIVKSGADAIFSTINGETNIEFYRQLLDQGITADKVPVVATSVGEEELRSIRPLYVQGHYAAWSYFQSIQ